MPRARELLTAHRAGGSATDDRNFGHLSFSVVRELASVSGASRKGDVRPAILPLP
jgi:hypothetical protein